MAAALAAENMHRALMTGREDIDKQGMHQNQGLLLWCTRIVGSSAGGGAAAAAAGRPGQGAGERGRQVRHQPQRHAAAQRYRSREGAQAQRATAPVPLMLASRSEPEAGCPVQEYILACIHAYAELAHPALLLDCHSIL